MSSEAVTGDADDRRREVRHRVFRVEVKVATVDGFRASYLHDVSEGGLFVRSARPLPVGSAVVVQLAVATLPPLELPGEVVRTDARGFAVRFLTLDEPRQEALGRLISTVRSTPPPSLPLELELAEARGTIEAYEEALVQLRESETEATLRAERAEFERALLADAVKELLARVAGLEAERTRLEGLAQASTEPPGVAELRSVRAELSGLTQLLDEERLKGLALQRALARFAAMGGVIQR